MEQSSLPPRRQLDVLGAIWLRLAAPFPARRIRLASSTSSSSQDPKSRAAAAIDAIPGNSLVSKTGSIVLGTALTGAAIGTELFVVNEEIVVGVSFALLIGYLSTVIRAPYSEWAEGQIQKFKDILNQSRAAHTQAVQGRIDTVNEMKDVVGLTEQMFALSKVGLAALQTLTRSLKPAP